MSYPLRAILVLLTAFVLASAAAMRGKVPFAYDGNATSFLYNGKQNMPFVLYSMAIELVAAGWLLAEEASRAQMPPATREPTAPPRL